MTTLDGELQSQFEQLQFLSVEEFKNPQFIHPDLLSKLNTTRAFLQRPMYFTYHRGVERHPNGDAVPANSTSHSPSSLHKYYLFEDNTVDTFCTAQDWDCQVGSREELWEVYLQLEKMNVWGGVGLYPYWTNRGFHTDLRSIPARWFRDQHGTYHNLTWKNIRTHIV
jgi:hypothetical protein